MANLEVQAAFLDGIQEIYEELFTTDMQFCFMDDEKTEKNFYLESSEKIYKEPITLTAKINTNFEQGELFVEGIKIDALINVPTKQFQVNNIPVETGEDLEILRRGKFIYQGTEYFVKRIQTKGFVADINLVYIFYCYTEKPSSLNETSSLDLDEGGSERGRYLYN